MDWTESLRRAVDFMEQNILSDITPDDVAKAVCISPFYLERGFKVMTGFSIGEYVRNRRLYLSALDILSGNEKVIDIALKYGYDTPESYTKAFTRFHGRITGTAQKRASQTAYISPSENQGHHTRRK